MTKEIGLNICSRRHDTICTYNKHHMYLSGSQVRIERDKESRPPCKQEGATGEQEKENERGVNK
jgi:hypothetical protein